MGELAKLIVAIKMNAAIGNKMNAAIGNKLKALRENPALTPIATRAYMPLY